MESTPSESVNARVSARPRSLYNPALEAAYEGYRVKIRDTTGGKRFVLFKLRG